MNTDAHPSATGAPARPSGRPAWGDVIAGISVALVLIPQALAYAELAGMPPVYGLYAAILPPIVAAFFASSPYLQTGPVAVTSMLTLAALAGLAAPGTAAYLALAPVLALVVGVLRLAVGLAGAGFVAYLMSQPVMLGFTSAAALLILASQLPPLLGLPSTPGEELARALSVVSMPDTWSWAAIALGLFTIVAVLGGRRIHVLFPGVLVAVAVGVIVGRYGGYAAPLVGAIPVGLPGLPTLESVTHLRELLVPGIVIALVGFAEPAAIARALATQDRKPWSANRELVGQGMANIAAGLSSAFPVGGSFSRTMVNRLAGGRTRWSGAITGFAVLAFLPFASLLAPLPKAVLAGVIIAAVLKLVQVRALWALGGVSRAQAFVGWATFVLTLWLAPRVDLAVGIGVALGVGVHLWRERRIHIAREYDLAQHVLTLVPVGVLYFGSANVVDEALLAELVRHPDARRVIFDLRRLGRIDYTGALVLQRIVTDAQAAALTVEIIPGQPPQGDRLLRRVFGADSPVIVSAREPAATDA
jgi:SulP family sulfate permease